MADDVPFYAPHRPPIPPRQRKPGEKVFEFYRERDQTRSLCELRDYGRYGIEAQFYRNEEFVIGHRFDTRALAVAWAEHEGPQIEKGA